MATLHTFGCSITQGHALPDVVRVLQDETGRKLTDEEIESLGIRWDEIHILAPSKYAWPAQLARMLDQPVINHARRGACFQQIARQCVANIKSIQPEDTVIVMWTYFSRLSLQWPSRTSVPFCNIVDPKLGWRTVILGFNRLFGLSHSDTTTDKLDNTIQAYIESATKNTYMDNLGVYNRYYNNLVLQATVDGLLRGTGARVIHLSVESQPVLSQLDVARLYLDPTLQEYSAIPDPAQWYDIAVDYACAEVILDPHIPLAENDMHPSVKHHVNFAAYLKRTYFKDSDNA